jgi:hypothetical protein
MYVSCGAPAVRVKDFDKLKIISLPVNRNTCDDLGREERTIKKYNTTHICSFFVDGSGD